MATWDQFGLSDLRAPNALQSLVVEAANSVVVVCCVLVAVAAGCGGASFARRLPITALTAAITSLEFLRTVALFLGPSCERDRGPCQEHPE
jgi:hypothetical protein